jgi:hypothetical protein
LIETGLAFHDIIMLNSATRRLGVLGRQLTFVGPNQSPLLRSTGTTHVTRSAVVHSSTTSGGGDGEQKDKSQEASGAGEQKGFSRDGQVGVARGDEEMSFIDKAKAGGANMLLGLFHARGDRFGEFLKASNPALFAHI